MRIITNAKASNGYRDLDTNSDMLATSPEEFLSGIRINRAADDAAGRISSENLDSADQNRLQSTIARLQVATQNLSASRGRFRDADMATEMVDFARDQILLRAGTAMLAHANAAPKIILRLLQ